MRIRERKGTVLCCMLCSFFINRSYRLLNVCTVCRIKNGLFVRHKTWRVCAVLCVGAATLRKSVWDKILRYVVQYWNFISSQWDRSNREVLIDALTCSPHLIVCCLLQYGKHIHYAELYVVCYIMASIFIMLNVGSKIVWLYYRNTKGSPCREHLILICCCQVRMLYIVWDSYKSDNDLTSWALFHLCTVYSVQCTL